MTKLITICSVNLRSEPKIPSSILMVLPRNTALKNLGASESWMDIKWVNVELTPKVIGWVATSTQQETPLITEFVDTNFGWSLRFVLWQEGGIARDSNDRGGVTKFGISQASHPWLNVRLLTIEDVKNIYLDHYWRASGADKLPWPLCLHHFDFAVNAGVGQANSTLVACGDDLEAYKAARREFYTTIPGEDYQRVAWLNRVKLCEAEERERGTLWR